MANQTPATLPYLGSKISLISNAEIRYEGILYTINTQESTVALASVRSFGTEGRKSPEIPPSDDVYEFIIFRGKDIKDLKVCGEPRKMVPNDPAIVDVNVAPSRSSMIDRGMGDHPQGQMSDMRGVHGMDRGMGYGQGHHGDRYGGQGQRGPVGYGGNVGRGPGMSGYPREDNERYGDYQDNYGRGGRYGGSGGYNTGYGNNMPYSHRGGRYHGGQRYVVGELVAQPNPATKNQVANEFDFGASNSHFDKSAMKRDEVEKEGVTVRPGYEKSSFFDNISCETLDRQSGQETKIDRDRQRQLDTETFGQAANQRNSRYRRGYRRGVGYRRGRGGHGGYGYGPFNSGPGVAGGRQAFGRGF